LVAHPLVLVLALVLLLAVVMVLALGTKAQVAEKAMGLARVKEKEAKVVEKARSLKT